MSEPQPEAWDYFLDWSNNPYEGYDWSKVDLLDACLDPMLESTVVKGCWTRFGSTPAGESSNTISSNENLGTVMAATAFSTEMTQPLDPAETRNGIRLLNVACAACGEVITDYIKCRVEWKLDSHAKRTSHLSWACSITDCRKTFSTHRERDAHQQRPHVLGHSRLYTPTPYDCVECGHRSSSKANLLRHAKELQHQPYACECGSSFSRLDVLNRHLEKFDPEEPKHPCRYCKRHRGPNGFRRLDHLMQHIRNYHHHEVDIEQGDEMDNSRIKYKVPICPHPDCPEFRNETFKQQLRQVQQANKPFASQSAFTKHMRDEHNECTFPCDVAGCERVGRRGYFREKDLLKHRRTQHPDAPPYAVEKRATRWTCTRPGCDANIDFSSMPYHLTIHEWSDERNQSKLLPQCQGGDLADRGLATDGSIE